MLPVLLQTHPHCLPAWNCAVICMLCPCFNMSYAWCAWSVVCSRAVLSLPACLSKRERAMWHQEAERLALKSQSTVRGGVTLSGGGGCPTHHRGMHAWMGVGRSVHLATPAVLVPAQWYVDHPNACQARKWMFPAKVTLWLSTRTDFRCRAALGRFICTQLVPL